MTDRTRRERQSQRMRRVRERIDEALVGFDYEPSYLLSDGDYLHPHVECQRCRAVIKAVGMAPFEHWATHHRLRAATLRWVQRRLARERARIEGTTLSRGEAHVSQTFADLMGQQGIDRLNGGPTDVSTTGAKPVHSETTEPREDQS